MVDLKTRNSDLVVTSNKYVEAVYAFTPNEEKIIFCAIVAARKLTSVDQDTFVDVFASDFGSLVGIENREAYRALRRAAAKLKTRFVIFDEIDPVSGKQSQLEIPLFTALRYVPDAGVIRLRFTKEIIPHFMQLINGNFTQHEIGYLSKLSSIYSIRLYRFFHKELWKNKPFYMELDFLKEIFQLENKYPNVKDFRLRVIDTALKEINESTDLTVSYEPVRQVRKVIGFTFHMQKNPSVLVDQIFAERLVTQATEPKKGMTDKQATVFANKLANDLVFGSEFAAIGEENYQFCQRLKQELMQGEYVEKYKIYLMQYGFLSTSF